MFLLGCLSSFGQAQGIQATSTTNIDNRWQRSVPAGPFQEVSTSYGTLQTTIPIFSLEGPGRSGMSFTISHRSNTSTSPYGIAPGGAGKGWVTSGLDRVDMASPRYYQYKSGYPVQSWRCFGNFFANPRVWTREPGTRADINEVRTGSGDVQKVEILNRFTQSTEVYDVTPFGPTVPKFFLGKVVDAYGNTVTYTYDSFYRLSKIQDAAGRYALFDYQLNNGQPYSDGQLLKVRLYAGTEMRQWDFVYGTSGADLNRLMRIDFPYNGAVRPSVSFLYNYLGSIAEFYDFNNWRYVYTYGSSTFHLGDVVRAIQTPLALNNGSPGTRLTWENYPSLTNAFACAVTDEYNNVRRYVHIKGIPASNDPNYYFMPLHLLRVVDPPTALSAGGTWTWYEDYTWNYADCTLTRYVDRLGHATDFTYTPDNYAAMVQKRVWKSASTYDDWRWIYQNWQVVSEISPLGNRVRTVYDTNYRHPVQKIVDPTTDPFDGSYSKPSGLNLTSNFAYNTMGELTDEWSGSDAHTVYSNFDVYGNARTITPPSNNATLLTFDAWGNKLTVQEPAPGGTTSYQYDPYNRVTKTTFPDTKFTTATYDKAGNVTQTVDERNVVTNMVYAEMGLLASTTVVRPAGNVTTSYHYNLRGEQDVVYNPNNEATGRTYDERGKVRQTTYPDGTTRAVEYDGNGNVLYSRNGRGAVVTYTYDWLNRLTNVNYPSANTPDVSYTYYNDGLRASMTDGTGTTNYNYDGARRLTSTTGGYTGKTVTTTYDASSRKKTLAAGSQTWTYNYNTALQLSSIGQATGAATPATFAYYANGSVKYRQGEKDIRTWFDYDNRGRTKLVSHRQGALGSETEKERIDTTFDNSGFPLQQIDTRGATVATTNYVHDELGRLTSEVRTGAAAGNFNNVYNYDKAGNRDSVVRNGTTYAYTKTTNDRFLTGEGYSVSSYDNDGNPLTMTVPGVGTQTMAYDDASRLLSLSRPGVTVTYKYDGDGRRVERVTPSGTTRYLYDGTTEIATLNSANTILRYRLPGVGDVDGGVQGYDQEDPLGSVLATRNNSGNDVSRQSTDAYGLETVLLSGPKGDHRWAGKHGYVRDDEAGMVMMGARYYVPQLGRFLTQDPIGQQGGLNLYAYCMNSPLKGVDPSGTYIIEFGWHKVIPIGTSPSHGYLLITDNVKGSKTYGYRWAISGGPERFGFDSLKNPGQLTDYSGFYKPGQLDWVDPGVQTRRFVLDSNDQPVAPLLNEIARIRSVMRRSYVTYDLMGPNSNSFVAKVMKEVGYMDEYHAWFQQLSWRRAMPQLPGFGDDPWSHLDFSNKGK